MKISDSARDAIARGVARGDCIVEMEALGLSQRIINSLEYHLKITTLGQLMEKTTEDLINVPNIGETALKQLMECLEHYPELDQELQDEENETQNTG